MKIAAFTSAALIGVATSLAVPEVLDDETFYNLTLPEFTPSGDRIIDWRSDTDSTTTLSKRKECDGGGGRANSQCVRYYSGSGCKNENHIKGYKPTCEGNCYVDKFYSVKAVGDGTYSTNCELFSDTQCQNSLGSVGSTVGGMPILENGKYGSLAVGPPGLAVGVEMPQLKAWQGSPRQLAAPPWPPQPLCVQSLFQAATSGSAATKADLPGASACFRKIPNFGSAQDWPTMSNPIRDSPHSSSEVESSNSIDTPLTDDSPKSEDASEKSEKIIIGMLADTKDVFAKFDAEGNRSWSDNPPTDLEEAPENETTKKFAIIVRKKKPKQASSTKPLEIDSLVIQSPLLKRALADILQDYPGIITDVTRLKFFSPFECFVHRWEGLEKAMTDEDRDATTREHLQLLHKILTDELSATIQLKKDYFKNKATDFSHCWLLFTPGCTILTELHGQPIAARFNSGTYVQTQCGLVYSINCSYVDWDGVRVGWVEKSTAISQFHGTKPFSKLSCHPLEYHPERASIEVELRQRGRRWEALRGFRYKAYNGVALYTPDQKTLSRERVNCRIVLDGARWEDANPNHLIYLETIQEADQSQVDYEMPPLNDYHILLTSPIVRGYSLKNKRWMQFFIGNVQEIEFHDGAFDSLVLSEERKKLILAFAQSQVKHRDSFDDVIKGKGRGIIMLLSGGPGIGKTLTAEVVAEQMRVPLYTMSAGDLGSSSYDVDENLTKLMSMVSNWNAVLLLDECDVFLEERTAADLERNRIVSIFLRTLEYYEGILFLTTNRINNMDTAFQSRIHLTLEYPNLDAVARRAIWTTFLDRAAREDSQNNESRISEAALKSLCALDLNGRQIKNIMKMAQLLAMQTGSVLTYEHVQTVLNIQGHTVGAE
ncbi:hypothetical protein NLG97_g826 [Lecanicillium saksenae]|uniref:Uncharacterized protein n=1 Tax=Lecanicillium saksenae TaxID=468837 RepID=A0ACC1R6S2_9HYPO|nr:hypothetical protein NLG97_g826 [Lecanicillium saksenae]